MKFQTVKQVRFAHCDPAGIGFYPRYVEMINEVVEDWFNDGLKIGFSTLHQELRLGLPTVHLSVEYLQPSRYGDRLNFSLAVLKIGNSSMTLEISATGGRELRLRAELTVVMVQLDRLQSIKIDEEWSGRFGHYLLHEER